MPRKCSVGCCTGNYASSNEKVRIFRFPKEPGECEKWISVLPNKISKVTPHIGICERHWPPDAEFVRIRRFSRPKDPPSVFVGCSNSMQRQTIATNSREVETRRITASSRHSKPDELVAFDEKDMLPVWEEFLCQLSSSETISNRDLLIAINKERKQVKLLKIVDNTVEFCIEIFDTFAVKAHRSNTSVGLRARGAAGPPSINGPLFSLVQAAVYSDVSILQTTRCLQLLYHLSAASNRF